MDWKPKGLFRSLLLALVLAVPAVAAEESADSKPAAQANDTSDHAGDESGVHHRHHAGLLLGNSWIQGDPSFTIGGEYEYRFHRHFGAGTSGDYIAAKKKDIVVVTFPLVIHPIGELAFAAGPGFEWAKEKEGARHSETEFVLRVIASYDFFIGDFSITPTFEWDVTQHSEVYVAGSAFGWGF